MYIFTKRCISHPVFGSKQITVSERFDIKFKSDLATKDIANLSLQEEMMLFISSAIERKNKV